MRYVLKYQNCMEKDMRLEIISESDIDALEEMALFLYDYEAIEIFFIDTFKQLAKELKEHSCYYIKIYKEPEVERTNLLD